MNKKIRSLMSDTVIFAVGNMLSKLVLFLLMPFYTTILSASEYGISDTINNFVELLLPITTLCISEAVFRFLIDNRNDSLKILKNGLYINVIGCLITTIVAFILNIYIGFSWMGFLLLLLWTQVIRQFLGYALRGLGRTKVFALMGFLATIFLVLFNVIFLKILHFKIEGYLLSIVCSNVVTIIISSIFLFRADIKNTTNSRSYTKDMLKYSLPIVPNNVSWWVNTASNRYILLYFFDSTLTGMYAAASKLPAVINMLAAIFQQAWMYSASKMFNEDSEDKSYFYSIVFKYYSIFLNISCSFVIFTIPILSKILLRQEFYNSWKFIPLLLISAWLGAYSVFFGGLYAASMNNKVVMKSTMLGAIINILFSFLLVPLWGIYGVAIASLICYLAIVLYRYIDTKKIVNLNVNVLKIILSFIIMIIQSIAHITLINQYLVVNGLLFLSIIGLYYKEIFIVLKKLKTKLYL